MSLLPVLWPLVDQQQLNWRRPLSERKLVIHLAPGPLSRDDLQQKLNGLLRLLWASTGAEQKTQLDQDPLRGAVSLTKNGNGPRGS